MVRNHNGPVGKDWQCISCGEVLGHIIGNELTPTVPGENLITRGPNLVVVCPSCGASKVFYTSDPVVRAIYQLIDAVSSSLAKRVVSQLSRDTLRMEESRQISREND